MITHFPKLRMCSQPPAAPVLCVWAPWWPAAELSVRALAWAGAARTFSVHPAVFVGIVALSSELSGLHP